MPWSTVYLGKYPIPPDALPVVLKVWARSQTRPAEVFDPELEVERLERGINDPKYSWKVPDPDKRNILTIREALWVARLSYVIKHREGESDEDYLDRLWADAWASAVHEYVLATEGIYPAKREHILHFWREDASLCQEMDIKEADEIKAALDKEYIDNLDPGYRKKRERQRADQ